MYYYYSDGSSEFMTTLMLISLISSIFLFVCLWFVFKKMGHPGWKGIIPGYNLWILFEDTYGSGPKCFMMLIPFYGIYVAIRFYIDLAHDFNKSTAWGWGMALLSAVFFGITAFSKSIVYKDGSMAITDNNTASTNVTNTKVIADELRDLKALYDSGILTTDEYEIKRKELVNKL